MDIDRKFTQLFSADPKDQPFMANMSDARAQLVYKAQRDAFRLGADVMQQFMLEEQAKEKDDKDEQNDLEHLHTGDF